MNELVKCVVSERLQASLMLPRSWRVANLSGHGDMEARRLVASWPLIADALARDAFIADLSRTLRQAAEVGATFVAILSGDKELPVAGSMVVSDLDAQPFSSGRIELEWRAAGRQCSRHSLPVGPAVLTEQIRKLQPGSDSSIETWELQIAIPAATSGGLLLVFATPMATLAEHFRTVALAIVSTLRWQSRLETLQWQVR